MSTPSRLLDTTAAIELADLEPDSVRVGSPRAGTRELGTLGDAEIGIWEMTEGVASDVEVDEVFVVLSGSATVVVEGAETLELEPGSAVRLYAGDRTVWTVHQRLRKLYLA